MLALCAESPRLGRSDNFAIVYGLEPADSQNFAPGRKTHETLRRAGAGGLVKLCARLEPRVCKKSRGVSWETGPKKVSERPQCRTTWSSRLRPAVRTAVVRTAFSAFNGSFRCASLCPGLPGCRDCSHAATKVKVDAEHPTRLPGPLPRAVVVILWKCPEKSRSNAP